MQAKPEATSRPMRLQRISLRALLALMTLATIFCGIYFPSIRKQRAAVATIESLGGSVRYDFQQGGRESNVPRWLLDFLGEDTFHRVIGVNVNTQIIGNSVMSNSTHVPEVWDALPSLPHVRRFAMEHGFVPSDSFKKIQSLTKLESVRINDVVLDDESIAALVSLKQLRIVSIMGGELTDSALDVMSQLPHLETLRLEGKFSNRALAKICGASKLKELQLSGKGSTISDEGIQYLLKLKKLKILDLTHSLVTGDGLKQMAPMKSLKQYHLGKTKVTWSDADSFKKAFRPDVQFKGYLERQ